MRKLAKHLGYEVMSLYNHIANKDDLLEAMVDVVAGEITEPLHEPGMGGDEAQPGQHPTGLADREEGAAEVSGKAARAAGREGAVEGIGLLRRGGAIETRPASLPGDP